MYRFHFAQQVLGTVDSGARWLRWHIDAETHLDAFQAWCALPSVQDIPMHRLGTLKIEVTAL